MTMADLPWVECDNIISAPAQPDGNVITMLTYTEKQQMDVLTQEDPLLV